MCNSPEEARNATTGDISLCFCKECGLVFNQKYDPDLIKFGDAYEVSLTCSNAFNEFQLETANRLAHKYNLQGKTVFEIGCGNGEFLELLCSTAECDGVGIDPTVKTLEEKKVGDNRLRFFQQKFDEAYEGPTGDFVCCLSVFEDVPQPGNFLSLIAERFCRKGIPVYLEVFNGMRALGNKEVWSVHYEQCNYFSLQSLMRAVGHHDLTILGAGNCYVNGQYVYVEFTYDSDKSHCTNIEADDLLESDQKVVSEFETEFQNRKRFWEKVFNDSQFKNIAFWGSGGKSISFLNSVENSSRVGMIVDNNSKRHGGFIPGSGHEVVGPEKLVDFNPDLVIISNEIYRDEIGQQLSGMGLSPRIEVA